MTLPKQANYDYHQLQHRPHRLVPSGNHGQRLLRRSADKQRPGRQQSTGSSFGSTVPPGEKVGPHREGVWGDSNAARHVTMRSHPQTRCSRRFPPHLAHTNSNNLPHIPLIECRAEQSAGHTRTRRIGHYHPLPKQLDEILHASPNIVIMLVWLPKKTSFIGFKRANSARWSLISLMSSATVPSVDRESAPASVTRLPWRL